MTVFERCLRADISASVVWIPVLGKDLFQTAIPSANLPADASIQHFYDSRKMVGKAVAHSVGWRGNAAGDVYATGDVIVVRFCDDFVVGFQHHQDAVRFLEALTSNR